MSTGSESGSGLLWRAATFEDVPFIAGLLEEFYKKRVDLFQIPFDRRSTMANVADIIDTGVCVVGPTSCAGATLHHFIVNRSARVAFVQFWYFREAREILVFNAMARAARAAGATHITGAAHAPEFTIGRWYAGLGMDPKELHFMSPL